MMIKEVIKEFLNVQKEALVLFPKEGIPDKMREVIICKLREKTKTKVWGCVIYISSRRTLKKISFI